jgi:hypothetical protein
MSALDIEFSRLMLSQVWLEVLASGRLPDGFGNSPIQRKRPPTCSRTNLERREAR